MADPEIIYFLKPYFNFFGARPLLVRARLLALGWCLHMVGLKGDMLGLKRGPEERFKVPPGW